MESVFHIDSFVKLLDFRIASAQHFFLHIKYHQIVKQIDFIDFALEYFKQNRTPFGYLNRCSGFASECEFRH